MGSVIQIGDRAVPEPSNDIALTTGSASQAEVETEKYVIKNRKVPRVKLVQIELLKEDISTAFTVLTNFFVGDS